MPPLPAGTHRTHIAALDQEWQEWVQNKLTEDASTSSWLLCLPSSPLYNSKLPKEERFVQAIEDFLCGVMTRTDALKTCGVNRNTIRNTIRNIK